MSDRELDDLLQSLAVPPPPAEARERALQAVREAWEESPLPVSIMSSHRRIVIAAATAIAAGIALAFVLWSWRPAVPPQSAQASADWDRIVAQEERMLHELREMFPHNLLGVVSNDEDIELRLSAKPTAVSDQPIVVQICKPGGACVRVLSFSGQTIETEVDGRPIRLELLVTGSDEVLICGRDFVWTSGSAGPVDDLHLQAQALGV